MKFIGTRGGAAVDFCSALLSGAGEGGLFVPESFPAVTPEEIESVCGMDYAERCAFILRKFCGFNEAELRKITERYAGKFEEDEPAPLLKIDGGTYILELFHGPTAAFKDLALVPLPALIAAAKSKLKDKSKTLILTATSGDTGKAAMSAFADEQNARTVVLYPDGGVSEAQEAQMLDAPANALTLAVTDNFDGCQRKVKELFADADFNKKLAEKNYSALSANSINIGRLIAQITYYFSAYADLLASGEIKAGGKIDFAVPTGNFGNILAAVYAAKCGLPVNKLICASNANDVLTDFFKSGVYDADREFKKTISPSMDILISSNLERFIFELSARNAALTAERAEELKRSGRYKITEAERRAAAEIIYAGKLSEADTLKTIDEFFAEYDYLLDPHTAVAAGVYGEYKKNTGGKTPAVIVATAHPYKFAGAVYEAVFGARPDDLALAAEELRDISAVEIPSAFVLKAGRKKTVVNAAEVKRMILDYVG